MAEKTPQNIQLLSHHRTVGQLATKPFHLHSKMGKPIYNKTLGNEYFFQSTRHSFTETHLKKNSSLETTFPPHPIPYIIYSVTVTTPKADQYPHTSTHCGFQVGKGYRGFVTSTHFKKVIVKYTQVKIYTDVTETSAAFLPFKEYWTAMPDLRVKRLWGAQVPFSKISLKDNGTCTVKIKEGALGKA